MHEKAVRDPIGGGDFDVPLVAQTILYNPFRAIS